MNNLVNMMNIMMLLSLIVIMISVMFKGGVFILPEATVDLISKNYAIEGLLNIICKQISSSILFIGLIIIKEEYFTTIVSNP